MKKMVAFIATASLLIVAMIVGIVYMNNAIAEKNIAAMEQASNIEINLDSTPTRPYSEVDTYESSSESSSVEEETEKQEENKDGNIEVDEDIVKDAKLHGNKDVANMIADLVLKSERNLSDEELNQILENADKSLPGGRDELRGYIMTDELFKSTYKAVMGEEYDAEEKDPREGLSDEEIARLEAEAAAEVAELAKEKEQLKEQFAQIEKEKQAAQQAAQSNTGTVKYGSLYTPEEKAAMRSTDTQHTTSLEGQDHSGGTPIIGFH